MNIKQLEEELRMAIYKEIKPISGIGGKKLIEAIDRMIDNFLSYNLGNHTIQQLLELYKEGRLVEITPEEAKFILLACKESNKLVPEYLKPASDYMINKLSSKLKPIADRSK